ncbi:MAG TPA: hypothetical protein VHS28_04865, partial [Chloroflexota bacterium]|nr:hypothetical protein [Chloroflexota bacterium]
MNRSPNGRDCQRPLAPVSLLFALLLALATSSAVVLAAAGDGTGTVNTNLSGSGVSSSFDEARAVAVQSDGKIVVVGNSAPNGGYSRFALARYARNW